MTMEESNVKWKLGKTIIPQKVFIHSTCKNLMRFIGSAGCAHDSDWTYFYQCPACKDVESSSRDLDRYGMSEQDFINAGYKKI